MYYCKKLKNKLALDIDFQLNETSGFNVVNMSNLQWYDLSQVSTPNGIQWYDLTQSRPSPRWLKQVPGGRAYPNPPQSCEQSEDSEWSHRFAMVCLFGGLGNSMTHIHYDIDR